VLLDPSDDVGSVATRLGWALLPEGLCRDSVCLPLAERSLASLAHALRMPLLIDAAARLCALGPPADAPVLNPRAALELVLPDLDGNPFALRELRGQKVLLLAWASW
jgi:hypothetical protein